MEKKSNTGLIVTIVILSVLVLFLGVYIIIDKFYSFQLTPKNTKNTSEVGNTKETTNTNDTKSLIKDSSKDVVYDHENYTPWVEAPYINIDSKDASRMNEEINSYYSKITKDYYESLGYSYYVNGDIVSIVIKYMPGGAERDYKVYNINQKTGYEVTNKELLSSKKLSLESLIKKMKAIFLEKVKTTEAYSMRIPSDDFTTVEQATYNNIEKTSLDSALLYLNDDGDLCIIEEEYQIAGAETGNYIMNINKSDYENN